MALALVPHAAARDGPGRARPPTVHNRKHSAVQAIRPESEPLARQVAKALGIARVIGPPPAHPRIVPATPDVIVLVGRDRMR